MILRKHSLIKKARKKKEGIFWQGKLKRKAGVEDPNVIIIEKSNTIKFMISVCGTIIRTVSSILLVGLSLVGLVALVYPAPRKELLDIFTEAVRLLFSFLI